MIKKRIKNCGFSLLEVMLYLAILSSLVFGVGSFINLVSVARVKNQTISEVNQQALQIIQNITQSIRDADSVVFPAIGNSQDSLTIVDMDDNIITFELDSDKFVISKEEGNINLSNDRVLVEDLVFKNLSRIGTPDIIQINFTVVYKNNSLSQDYNYSKNYVASAYLSK